MGPHWRSQMTIFFLSPALSAAQRPFFTCIYPPKTSLHGRVRSFAILSHSFVIYLHFFGLVGKVCITLLHHFVIGSTFLRLLYRWRTNRMWWDDYTAIIPLVIDVGYVIFMWWGFGGGRGKPYIRLPSPSDSDKSFLVSDLASRKLEGFNYSSLFAAIGWTIIWWPPYVFTRPSTMLTPQF